MDLGLGLDLDSGLGLINWKESIGPSIVRVFYPVIAQVQVMERDEYSAVSQLINIERSKSMELDNTDILILTWTTLTTKKRLRGRETSTSSMEPSVMKLAK